MTAPPVPRRILTEWAKEEILSFIDEGIAAANERADQPDFDDREELKRQRNRVAKFLGVEAA